MYNTSKRPSLGFLAVCYDTALIMRLQENRPRIQKIAKLNDWWVVETSLKTDIKAYIFHETRTLLAGCHFVCPRIGSQWLRPNQVYVSLGRDGGSIAWTHTHASEAMDIGTTKSTTEPQLAYERRCIPYI